MKKCILPLITFICLLSGCKLDSEYDELVKKHNNLATELNKYKSGERAELKLNKERQARIEQINHEVEWAIACDALPPITNCPAIFGTVDIEAHQKAGYPGSKTLRSWFVYLLGILIRLAECAALLFLGAYIWKFAHIPLNSKVAESLNIIEEAKKQRLHLLSGFIEEKEALIEELATLKWKIDEAETDNYCLDFENEELKVSVNQLKTEQSTLLLENTCIKASIETLQEKAGKIKKLFKEEDEE